jgi:hypothetical protein
VSALLSVAAGVYFATRRYVGRIPLRPGLASDTPAALSTWPWPGSPGAEIRPGITHWNARADDGTVVDLLQFDFVANPELRLELYDQDEDDDRPFDNEVDFFARGVGQITRHLTRAGKGPVLAAWNGLFFSAEETSAGRRIARHVAPVVLNGSVHHLVGNHRWTFGVQYTRDGPRFRAVHLPDRATLEREFTFAAAGAQCLVREGAPLTLQPFPKPGDKPLPRPVPSTPQQAGHIPGVDHILTSRTSMGWTHDSRRLYLLIVREPDSETGSAIAAKRGLPVAGGWTLHDLQRFWMSMHVWGAVNVDGGDVTQMVYRRGDGRYEMVPPRWATAEMRVVLPPELSAAPEGGTLMYFYVREMRR